MKEMLDRATAQAIVTYGGEATREFYRRLAEKRLCTTACVRCGKTSLPPRMFCAVCGGAEVRWIDLPKIGVLYAFTQQTRSIRFSAPDVVGLVEVPGAGRLLTRIDADFAALAIGQELHLDFVEAAPGLWLHQYRPSPKA